jgi:amino acid adenylation domain-containing protein
MQASKTVTLAEPDSGRGRLEPLVESLSFLSTGSNTQISSAKNMDRLTVDVNLEPSSQTALLQLCWAAVLARYADNPDIQYAYVLEDSEEVRLFRSQIPPGQDVYDALESAAYVTSPLGPIGDSLCQEAINSQTGNLASGTILLIKGKDSPSRVSLTREIFTGTALVLECAVLAQHVQVEWTCRKPLAPEYVYMIMTQFAHALRVSTKSGKERVCYRDLQQISPEGFSKIIRWNGGREYVKRETFAHHLVEKMVIKQPHAPAICAWDGDMTYAELDSYAEFVASQIMAACQIEHEGVVGLFFAKSKWTPVAMLGALKAGRGFIMLHTSQPPTRLRTICKRLGVVAVLSLPEFETALDQLGVPKIILSTHKDEGFLPSTASQKPTTLPSESNSILFAGFTSGSTGEPKIFDVRHSAFCSGISAWGVAMNVNERSRVFQSASYNFTVSMIEQLAPLCLGGCVCVPSEEALQNDIAGAIRDLGANWAEFTPSLARLLDPGTLSGVKTLILTGEALARADVEKWRSHLDLRVFYGQSEHALGTAVGNTADLIADHRNIGRTFSAREWIVDPEDHNRLAPLGAEGELLLEGPCVGVGYLNNPKETDATFVRNPAWFRIQGLTPVTDGRFLKTGDIVCYDMHRGCLQYRGRRGTQVKIRGQRVDLGEVEYHAGQHLSSPQGPPVAEVICPKEHAQKSDPVMVVFLVTDTPVEMAVTSYDDLTSPIIFPPNDKLRAQAKAAFARMKDFLPDYMMPSAVIPISHLPRTPSGKLSRRSLRDIGSQLALDEIVAYVNLRKPHRAPETAHEEKLQQISASILGCSASQIGMNDTFLELGGDSLKVRHLVQAARTEGVILSAGDIFKNLTLADLARVAQEGPMFVPAHEKQPEEPVVQSFLQSKPEFGVGSRIESVSRTHDIVKATGNEDAVEYFLFSLHGPLDVERLDVACQALVACHAVLRSVFIPYEDEIMQVTFRSLKASFEVIEASPGVDPKVLTNRLCHEDKMRSPFGPTPVMAFTVVRSSPDDHILVLRLSEAQCDAHSLKTMISNLMKLYEEMSIHVQLDYRDYLALCASQRTPEAFAYWRTLLKGATPLHLDSIRLNTQSSWTYHEQLTGKAYHHDSPPSLTFSRTIPPITPRRGITLATTIKAAWSYVLYKKSHCNDILFGQLGSCRTMNVPGIEDTVGPCTNVTPVRVKYVPQWDPSEILQKIQEQHAQSLPYQTIGWRDIINHCTAWPTGSSLQTVVLHQGEQEDTEIQTQDGLKCRALDWSASSILGRLYLMTEGRPSGLNIELCVPRGAIDDSEAGALFDLFCSAMAIFAK